MKIKKVVLIFVLIFFILVNKSYAANEAIITLIPDKDNYDKGEEISLGIKVKNDGVEEGIYDIMGVLEFDNSSLELVILDEQNLSTEQQQTLKKAEQLVGLLDILCVTDKCLIGGVENGSAYLITIVYLDEQKTIEYKTEEEIGKIKFKVLNSTSSGKKEIKFTDIEANSEFKVSDTVINININGINIEENKIEEPIQNKEQYQEIEENDTVQEVSNENIENLAYTGSNDYIPFIIILIIISISSYIKYNKYRNIT